MDLIRLDSRHQRQVTQFLIKYRTESPFSKFDADHFCIAISEEMKLRQIFFIELTDVARTKLILGEYRNDSYKLFDALCSMCASRTPEVVDHEIYVEEKDQYNCLECFKKSRLGTYAREIITDEKRLVIKIEYPE